MTTRKPRVGDHVLILPSDGTYINVPAVVRKVYRDNSISVMVKPEDIAELDIPHILHPVTGLVHYIVFNGDYDLFKRGD
jgi:surface antigen